MFTPITTQDELDDIISRRIARERKRLGGDAEEVAELRDEVDVWRRRAKYNRTALQQTEKLYDQFLDRFEKFLDKEFDDE